ncbi:MAG: NAD(P)-dependent oxidoreductase [Lachnospiraceae bacterium]|nr:NAD(P)-dependent oxidoreductase [Lachnospiraceae bacterium]
MKVVVSGATSMLGVALIENCIAKKQEVLALVRKGSKRIQRLKPSKYLRVVEMEKDGTIDIADPSYDVFYHFAWGNTTKDVRDLPLAQEENIRMSLEMVELAGKLGCKKFIGAGSQAEYGPVQGVIYEDTKTNPVTAYGMAKLAAGMLCKKQCERLGITCIWTRIFSVYGKNDNEGTMIKYAISKFENGETASFSSGVQPWNYLNEEDAGEMFYRFGEKNVEAGIYHVASEETKPLRAFIEELAMNYPKAKCSFAEVDVNHPPMGLEPDLGKTLAAIDYHPKILFSQGVKNL